MTMKKQTVTDQIEITRDGSIQLRFAKEILDDDGTVISSGWHRAVLAPGDDIDELMTRINENLVRDLKCEPVGKAHIDKIKAVTPVVWTKQVLDDYKAKMEKEGKDAERG